MDNNPDAVFNFKITRMTCYSDKVSSAKINYFILSRMLKYSESFQFWKLKLKGISIFLLHLLRKQCTFSSIKTHNNGVQVLCFSGRKPKNLLPEISPDT
jgi:hypothetical protein